MLTGSLTGTAGVGESVCEVCWPIGSSAGVVVVWSGLAQGHCHGSDVGWGLGGRGGLVTFWFPKIQTNSQFLKV